jgi:hypothetical protein
MENGLLLTLIAVALAGLGLWSIRRGNGRGSAGLGGLLSGTIELLVAVVLVLVALLRVFVR